MCSHISNYLDWILVSKGRVFWCHIKDPYWDNKKNTADIPLLFPSAGLKLQVRGSPLWCSTRYYCKPLTFKIQREWFDSDNMSFAPRKKSIKKICMQNFQIENWHIKWCIRPYTSVGQLLSKHPVINKVINNSLSRYWFLEDWVENLPFWWEASQWTSNISLWVGYLIFKV